MFYWNTYNFKYGLKLLADSVYSNGGVSLERTKVPISAARFRGLPNEITCLGGPFLQTSSIKRDYRTFPASFLIFSPTGFRLASRRSGMITFNWLWDWLLGCDDSLLRIFYSLPSFLSFKFSFLYKFKSR